MIVHEYETIYISRPELPGEEQERLGDRFRSAIEDQSGTILSEAVWGNRRLAYPINKHNTGHYTYVNFVGPNGLPIELERIVRLEENLIRFMTVRLGENANTDELKASAEQRSANIADRLAQATEEERSMSSSRSDYHDAGGGRGDPAPARAAAPAAAPAAASPKVATAPADLDDASATPDDAVAAPDDAVAAPDDASATPDDAVAAPDDADATPKADAPAE